MIFIQILQARDITYYEKAFFLKILDIQYMSHGV